MNVRWFLAVLILGACCGFAQTATRSDGRQALMTTAVDNKPSPLVEIIPIRAIPQPELPSVVTALAEVIPDGGFVLVNHSQTPIMAVTTLWKYIDVEGRQRQRTLTCESYLLAPVEPIVKAGDLALISPHGCAPRELVPTLRSRSGFGSPLDTRINGPLHTAMGSTIRVEVDSIIFEDGAIWGPDKSHYYTQIEERYSVTQDILRAIATSEAAGESLSSCIARLREELKSSKAKTHGSTDYAAILLGNPSPEATLLQLKTLPIPPNFRHIGE